MVPDVHKAFKMKSVKYSFEPVLEQEKGIHDFYLRKFFMIAIQEVLNSMAGLSQEFLKYADEGNSITVGSFGDYISAQKLTEEFTATVNQLFILNNLKPPAFRVSNGVRRSGRYKYIVLNITINTPRIIDTDDSGDLAMNAEGRAAIAGIIQDARQEYGSYDMHSLLTQLEQLIGPERTLGQIYRQLSRDPVFRKMRIIYNRSNEPGCAVHCF